MSCLCCALLGALDCSIHRPAPPVTQTLSGALPPVSRDSTALLRHFERSIDPLLGGEP